MEQNQDTSLFGLSIDPESRAHLSESARWSKFLAIVGFIMCGLLVVFGIFAARFLANFSKQFGGELGGPDMASGMTGVLTVTYIIAALIIFFPYLFLYRHSVYMKKALAANDQQMLNKSFQNQKIMYRYLGILTIIGLAFYIIAFLMTLASAGM